MSQSSVSVGWGRTGRAADVKVQRMPDTAANRSKLALMAGKDRLPSVVVDLGADVALLSGAGLRPVSAIADPGVSRIRKGAHVEVAGQRAKVLATDDGFTEIDASKVVIAVLDTGLNVDHVAFKGRVVKPFNALTGGRDVTDSVGHGSFVAGIAAGNGEPLWFAEGVAQSARIMPIKVFGKQKWAQPKIIARGIRHAVDNGAKIINLSLGGDQKGWTGAGLWGQMPELKAAIAYAQSKGVLVIAASGNSGKKRIDDFYPVAFPGVVAVGAVNRLGRKPGFSNGGDRLDVVAPGVDIMGPKGRGRDGYNKASGTSMAAPYVAGVAALVMAQHPDWTIEQVRAHLTRAVNERGKPGHDAQYGHGEIDAFKAVFDSQLPATPESQPKKTWQERVMSYFEQH